MSPRTLVRRLRSEGLTFGGILNELRCDLAQHYLRGEDVSISKIAWLLGYQEAGGFTHAFKRRTGKTVLIKLVCSFELPNRLTKTRRCTHRVERLECDALQPYLTPITID